MIEFTTVSREIRSLIARRRELLTFLGSTFAALGIVLDNVLQGHLPPALQALRHHTFAAYAVMLLVPSLILALRLAKLNAGLTINGIFYNELLRHQPFTEHLSRTVRRPGGRILSVSFLMFLLTDLIAGLAATLLALTLAVDFPWAPLIGAGVSLLWLLLYFYFNARAASFARWKVQNDTCGPFDRGEWEAHLAGSLQDVNHDMICVLSLVGLMVFSAFQGLSSLGKVTVDADLRSQDIQDHGPLVYELLMAVTAVVGMLTYLRLRMAVGHLSLQSDPTDRPFRPLRLTDSLLGYMLLAFLLTISLHLLLSPWLDEQTLLIVDAAAFGGAVLVEQLMLVVGALRYHVVSK